MNINKKQELLGICLWLKQQPEYTRYDKTSIDNICYHVAPLTYANLIYRFMEERKITDKFDENDWNHFHDSVYDVTEKSCTREELVIIFNTLPEEIKERAYEHGMSDTVWRDNFIDFYSGK